jgi:hypothetical protein
MPTQCDRLLLTGSDDDDISFYVLDIKNKSIVYRKTKQKELEGLPPTKGRPLFRPFGITTDDKYIYLASNDAIGQFDKFTFDFVKRLDVRAFVNTHQIIKHNKFLFICHTAVNCIGIHDLEEKTDKFLKLPEGKFVTDLPDDIYDASEYDTVHVNSLLLQNDKLYFCLHYRAQRKSRFGFIDISTFKIKYLFEAGISCHNIQIYDDTLYSLSTKQGNIIEYNLEKNLLSEYHVADPNRVFLRGLEKYEDGLIFCGSKLYTDIIGTVKPYIGFFDINNKTYRMHYELTEPKRITDCCWLDY